MTLVDINLVSKFLEDDLKENANKYESYTKLRGLIADTYIQNWVFDEIYPDAIVRAHKNGDFHLHNLSDAIVPYCKGHDATKILTKGLITQTVVAGIPKHLSSFFDQLVNLIATSQQAWAGAQAIANLNTLAAPFVRKYKEMLRKEYGITDEKKLEELTYKYIVQCAQSFIYNLNFPSRAGSQTPFSNIIFNFKCPEPMKDEPVLNDGCLGTWGDYEEEAKLIIKAFDEVFYNGDKAGRPFTFPIVTINLLPDTDYEDSLFIDMMKTQLKFGTYSFFNYDGTKIDPNSILSMCCRLSIDLNEVAEATGRWAYAGETGSIGVVTLNLPRLGYLSENKEDFYNKLEQLLKLAKTSLIIKGIFIEQRKEKFMPLDITYETDLTRFFRTIGIVGINEMCINMFGTPLKDNVPFVKEFLLYLKDWARKTQQETGVLWNIEMTPAEGCSPRFASLDKKLYGDNVFAQGVEGVWYYTAMLTASNDEMSIAERILIEEQLLILFSGGTVHRIYIGSNQTSPETLSLLIKRIAKNTKVTYFGIDPTYGICDACGAWNAGDSEICQFDGGHNTIWERIVGYYRPREQAGSSKVQEMKERHWNKL